MAMPVCRGCGQPISGRYLTALGGDWHLAHFCCAAGDGPINGSYMEHDGRPYHQACFIARFAPRCCVDGEPIPGTYLTNSWGQTFCAMHGRSWPRCRSCGRLIVGVSTSSDRCSVCAAAAVTEEADARARFAHLVQWAASHGLIVPAGTRIHIELVDRAALEDKQRIVREGETLGKAFKTVFSQHGVVTKVQSDKVLVERGLPTPLFDSVALHELGHAWLAVQQVSGLPAWAEEGFCELLAYRWLSEQGTTETRFYAEQTAENPDPVYGDGFRRLRNIAERIGMPALLAHLSTAKTLPPVAGTRPASGQ